MAENFGSVVLQAFLSGQQNKMRRDQLEQQKVRQQEQTELQRQRMQEQMRQFQEEQKMKNEQFKIKTGLEKAQLDIESLVKKSQITGNVGKSVADGLGTAVTNPETGLPELVVNQTPEAVGVAKEVVGRPIRDAELESDLTKQNNAAANQINVAGKVAEITQPAKVELAKLNHELNLTRDSINNNARMKVAQLSSATRLAAARTAKEVQGLSDEDLNEHISEVKAGTLSLERMKELKWSSATINKVVNSAKKQGFHTLGIQQSKDVTNMGALTNIYKNVLELNQLYKEGSPLKAARLREQIISTLGTLATQTGDQKGALTKIDLEQQLANIPSQADAILDAFGNSFNDTKVKKLFNTINTKKNKTLVGVDNPEQRYEIIQNFSLLPDPLPKGAPTKIPKGAQ